MKLYFSPASPFARKCRVLIREKGLLSRVEEIRVDPIAGDASLNAINPLGQVPAFIDDSGLAWTDSPLICSRLDAISGDPKLIPDGEARWNVLRREVFADGVLEVGVKQRLEMARPEGERSSTWPARWRASMLRGLDAAEAGAAGASDFDLAAIATVCALTWVDFRFPDLGWKATRPNLAALQAELEQRPAFRETVPA